MKSLDIFYCDEIQCFGGVDRPHLFTSIVTIKNKNKGPWTKSGILWCFLHKIGYDGCFQVREGSGEAFLEKAAALFDQNRGQKWTKRGGGAWWTRSGTSQT